MAVLAVWLLGAGVVDVEVGDEPSPLACQVESFPTVGLLDCTLSAVLFFY